jgi:glucose-1-phosphate thymidylyltransferase
MRAIIPVAGFGSRLRPHTFTQPKVLLNVAGKPIIGHILDKIIRDGFQEATIIVGYLGDKVRHYVSTIYPQLRADFIEQAEPKGLAHAIYLAKETFTKEPLLIILGDTIFDVNLKPVISGTATAIGVKKVDDPRRFGVVELEGEYAKRLVEKPEHPNSNLAIVGLYWIRDPLRLQKAIEELFQSDRKTKGEYQLTDALQIMLDGGEKIKTFPVDGWYDCGKPETLLSTNRHLLDKMQSNPKIEGVVVIPPVYVSEKAKIRDSVIGPYATIAEGAIVAESIVRNSIVSEDAQVYKAMLEDSLVGMNGLVQGSFKRINIGDSSEIEFH